MSPFSAKNKSRGHLPFLLGERAAKISLYLRPDSIRPLARSLLEQTRATHHPARHALRCQHSSLLHITTGQSSVAAHRQGMSWSSSACAQSRVSDARAALERASNTTAGRRLLAPAPKCLLSSAAQPTCCCSRRRRRGHCRMVRRANARFFATTLKVHGSLTTDHFEVRAGVTQLSSSAP